jgi:hypothetical protein
VTHQKKGEVFRVFLKKKMKGTQEKKFCPVAMDAGIHAGIHAGVHAGVHEKISLSLPEVRVSVAHLLAPRFPVGDLVTASSDPFEGPFGTLWVFKVETSFSEKFLAKTGDSVTYDVQNPSQDQNCRVSVYLQLLNVTVRVCFHFTERCRTVSNSDEQCRTAPNGTCVVCLSCVCRVSVLSGPAKPGLSCISARVCCGTKGVQ